MKKTIPTVKGIIDSNIKSSDLDYQLRLNSPKETKAIVGIQKDCKEVGIVKVNGVVVWNNGKINFF